MDTALTTHRPVQLFFSCSKLHDADTLSKSDPYVVVYDKTTGGNTPIGRTEVVKNNLNPAFKTAVSMNFFFEMKQTLLLQVWDKDSSGSDDFLGAAECTLGTVVSSKASSLTLKLGTKGTITVTASYVGASKGTVSLLMRGRDMRKMDLFSKSDPYFIISRLLPSGQKHQVYKSEVIDNTLNPQWKQTPDLDLVKLCGGDIATPSIVVDCFDKDLISDDSMGSFTVSAEQLLQQGNREFELVKASKKTPGKTKSYGFISVDKCDFTKASDFLDYLRAGMEINIAFSIDFTGSNGNPRDPRSLHFYDPQRPNSYIRAMLAVSNVVQEYDTDRMFPAFGFGAIAPFTQGTSHFFPLNGNPQNAYLSGMQAVVDTYAALLPTLQFSGPTNFAPTIATMTEGARQARGVYTILLILTDGAITDMQDTIDAIVAADDAPLSIVIIGIGRADFSSMERLDGDGMMLRDRRGRVSRRDLVQFVPFFEFERRTPEELAAAVLQEVPLQVETWARINGITPHHFTK